MDMGGEWPVGRCKVMSGQAVLQQLVHGSYLVRLGFGVLYPVGFARYDPDANVPMWKIPS